MQFWRFEKRFGIVVPATSDSSSSVQKRTSGKAAARDFYEFGDFLVNINVYHGKKK